MFIKTRPKIKIPTKEVYMKSLTDTKIDNHIPIYICPKCKCGGMCRSSINVNNVDMKYGELVSTYKCNNCDYTEKW